jgi:hypothetical protein
VLEVSVADVLLQLDQRFYSLGLRIFEQQDIVAPEICRGCAPHLPLAFKPLLF